MLHHMEVLPGSRSPLHGCCWSAGGGNVPANLNAFLSCCSPGWMPQKLCQTLVSTGTKAVFLSPQDALVSTASDRPQR